MNILKKYIYRLICGFRYIYYVIFSEDLFKTNVNKWFFLNGDQKNLINHNLNENSTIFEVGGYTGIFTDKIIKKYNCNIYVFEPVEDFYNILIKKYKENPKIKVFHFGLSNKNETIEIGKSDDGSSVFKNFGETELIKLVDINDFIIQEKLQDQKIDLISINIEGGEYDLIERILCKYPNLFQCFQVQFHDFIENANEKRLNTLKLLNKNDYKKGYSFPFVWELFNK